jgi:hypothetical protein
MKFEAVSDSDDHDEEQQRRVEDMAEGMLDIIEDISSTPFEAMMSLSAVLSFVISEHAPSHKEAMEALKMAAACIVSTIETNEANGNVNWNQKTKH